MEVRRMQARRAVAAGLAGAAASTCLMIFLRSVGATSMNLEMMLGSMLTARRGLPSWILGLALYLGRGAVLGILYAVVMEILGQRGWAIGYMISCVHALVAGLLMPVTWGVHPLVRSGELAPPGIFASSLGVGGVIFFVLLHLLFGLIVGSVYGSEGRPDPSIPSFHARRPPSTAFRA